MPGFEEMNEAGYKALTLRVTWTRQTDSLSYPFKDKAAPGQLGVQTREAPAVLYWIRTREVQGTRTVRWSPSLLVEADTVTVTVTVDGVATAVPGVVVPASPTIPAFLEAVRDAVNGASIDAVTAYAEASVEGGEVDVLRFEGDPDEVAGGWYGLDLAITGGGGTAGALTGDALGIRGGLVWVSPRVDGQAGVPREYVPAGECTITDDTTYGTANRLGVGGFEWTYLQLGVDLDPEATEQGLTKDPADSADLVATAEVYLGVPVA